jgi:hypothetical protein
MPEPVEDDSPVTETIIEGINEWFSEHGLDPNDIEDCAGQISQSLYYRRLLWFKPPTEEAREDGLFSYL